jgi:hypothetical protein
MTQREKHERGLWAERAALEMAERKREEDPAVTELLEELARLLAAFMRPGS